MVFVSGGITVDNWLSTQYEKEKGDLCTSTGELCNPKKGRPTKAEQIAKRSRLYSNVGWYEGIGQIGGLG